MQGASPAEIQQAVQLHMSGRLVEAEVIYRRIIVQHPDDANCNQMLGMLLWQRGNDDAAEPLLRRSLDLIGPPGMPEWHNNFALFCRSKRRFEDAISQLQRALALNPSFAEAHDNLGLVMDDLGRHEEAEASYVNAAKYRPDLPQPHHHLAQCLWRKGQFETAIEKWQQAVKIHPGFAEAHLWLCAALGRLGRADEAIKHGLAAVQFDPNNPEAHMNLGCAFVLRGLNEKGTAAFGKALTLDPRHVGTLTNIAWLMHRQGRPDLAVTFYRKALDIDPQNVSALSQMGFALRQMHQIDEALAVCAKAAELDQSRPAIWVNLGSAVLETGDYVKGIDCFRKAALLDPQNVDVRSNLLLALQYDPDADREKVFAEHVEFGRIHETRLAGRRFLHSPDPDSERPLRIAYVSPYFRRHAVAAFVEPLLLAHDRSKFVISCYSDVRSADSVTQRIRSNVNHWHDVADLSADELADAVHANHEDILVDLTGHIACGRLLTFVRKPAPIQMTYIGYQDTTGLQAMDYRITDSIADPPGKSDSLHTEKLLRLPCFFCYRPPDDAPDVGPLPFATKGPITFGSLNHMAKFNPQVIRLWADVLRAVPDSRLLLLITAPGECARRLLGILADAGVSKDQVELVPRREPRQYMELYNRIDIALDSFPFSGHTTTCDALWMGVPVITLPGESYASRMTASVLTHGGLSELITSDRAQFVRIASELAGNIDRLKELRYSLRDRMRNSVITDAAAFTSTLEQAYREAWRTWCLP